MMPEGPALTPKRSDTSFFLIAFPVCLLLVLFLNSILPLHYSTVDDVEMDGLASGAFTGHPEFRLIFINALMGKLLQGLYELVPQLPWYGDYFLVCHAFALALLVTMTRHVGPYAGIAATSLGFCFHFYCFSDLQFTTTASLLGAYGILWLHWLANRREFSLRNGMWWIAFLALLMGWLLRKEAVAFTLITLSPLFLLIFFRERHTWLVRLAPLAAVLLVLIGTAWADQRLQYGDPAWARFNQYNQLRGMLQDAHIFNYENFMPEAEKVGWSKPEFQLFDAFMSDGKAPYDYETVRKMFDLAFPKLNSRLNTYGFQTLGMDILKYHRYLLLACLVLIAAAALAGRRLWPFWLVIAAAVVLMLVQAHYFGSKDRLIVATLSCLAVAAVYALTTSGEATLAEKSSSRRQWVMLVVFIALAVSGYTARVSLINTRLRHEEVKAYLATTEAMIGSLMDGKTVVNLDIYPRVTNDPFKWCVEPRAAKRAHYVPLGFYANSPYQEAMARKAGLNPDRSLLLQLYNEPGRYLLGNEYQAGLVLGFMRSQGILEADTASIGPYPYTRGEQLRLYRFGRR